MNTILVIIPVYNKESTVLRAINSVLEQQYKDLKLLIINDGSSDQSLALIEQIQDDRIVINSHKNQGVSATRNRGISYAQKHNYSWIAFLDADDYWQPHHLHQLVELQTTYPVAQVLSSNYRLINTYKKEVVTRFSNLPKQSVSLLEDFFNHQLLNTTINSSNYLIKTTSFDTIGIYNEQVTHGEDTELLIKIGLHLKTVFHHHSAVMIDKSAGNRSSKISMRARKLPDLSVYDNTPSRSFKKFLDLQRFAIAMDYKRYGLEQKFQKTCRKIDLNNLSNQQQKLLKTSRLGIKILDAIKKTSQALGWDLRSS